MNKKQKNKPKNILWPILFILVNVLAAFFLLEHLYDGFMVPSSYDYQQIVMSDHESKVKFYSILSIAIVLWTSFVVWLFLKGPKVIKIIAWVYSVLALVIIKGGIMVIDAMLGRPLRIKGKNVFAELEQGDGWSEGESRKSSDLDVDTRNALEALWLQNARSEHAGIPAFSRISIQLAAVGAPAKLIELSHKAALDEIKHTKLCLTLARGYGNSPYRLKPFPELLDIEIKSKFDTVETLVKEAVIDGCLLEEFFSDIAAKAAEVCKEPIVRDALKQISKDEKSHADFSWEVLKWLSKSSPDIVSNIVEEIINNIDGLKRPRAIPIDVESLFFKADERKLLAHGILPDESWSEIWDNRLRLTKESLRSLLESKMAA